MRRLIIVVGLLLTVLLLSSCFSTKSHQLTKNQTKIEGYVVQLNKVSKKALIVWGVSRKDVSKKTVNNLLKEARPHAIWFDMSSRSFQKLKRGQKVDVWTDRIKDTYPGQAPAHRLVIHN